MFSNRVIHKGLIGQKHLSVLFSHQQFLEDTFSLHLREPFKIKIEKKKFLSLFFLNEIVFFPVFLDNKKQSRKEEFFVSFSSNSFEVLKGTWRDEINFNKFCFENDSELCIFTAAKNAIDRKH